MSDPAPKPDAIDEAIARYRLPRTLEELMEGVPELLGEVQVEATFPDGRKLVTLHDPVA